jgi:hypothetical protein
MADNKFKVGDIVRIRADSDFAYQGKTMGNGKIIEIRDTEFEYRVMNEKTFTQNVYRGKDLEFARRIIHPLIMPKL